MSSMPFMPPRTNPSAKERAGVEHALGVRDPSRGLIDPRRHNFVPFWDAVMMLALMFTAIITPVEVALIDEGACITVLWILNRVIDLLFMIDIIIIFNMAYQEEGIKVTWVYSRKRIGARYLRGYFWVDFLSILPFWITGFVLLDMPMGGYWCSAASVPLSSGLVTRADALADMAVGGDTNDGVVVRISATVKIIKLMRMIKLARIAKASRVLKRVGDDILMGKLEMTFAQIKLIKMFLWISLIAHWQACMFSLVASYIRSESDAPTWIDKYIDNQEAEGLSVGIFDVYVAALYWSVMTLTSIGYGDIVPINTIERQFCCLYMVVAGISWTYVLGTAAGIAATLNPNAVLFQTTMDQLNHFMRQRRLPREMRMRLRDFFSSARRVHQVTGDAELLAKMSPLLQGTVACCANKPWLDQIWFLRDLDTTREERDFVADLSMKLRVAAFVSDERLPLGQLYILCKGMVVRLWRFHGANLNSVWGEDMLLGSRDLMCHAQAVALTYVEAFTLNKNQFDEVAALNPKPMQRVRQRMRKKMMQRAVLKYMCRKNGINGKDQPRSFVTHEAANGYTYVNEDESLARKLDKVLLAKYPQNTNAFEDDTMPYPTGFESSGGPANYPRVTEGNLRRIEAAQYAMEARMNARIDALGHSIEAMLLGPGKAGDGRAAEPTVAARRQMALQGKLAAAINLVVDRPRSTVQRVSAPPSEPASAATQPDSQAVAPQPASPPQPEPIVSAAQPSNLTQTHGCGLLADRADGDTDEMRRQEAYFKQRPQKPRQKRTKSKSQAEIKAGGTDEAPIGYGTHDA